MCETSKISIVEYQLEIGFVRGVRCVRQVRLVQ
jgi:hypothetical protein